MAQPTSTLSLTRPAMAGRDIGAPVWQYAAGLTLAVVGAMLLAVFFVVTAVVAGWASQLTDPAREAVLASRLGRVETYEAWLFPISVAAIALAKLGIALILWGIVRRLWIRVESVKQSLPALMKRGSAS
mgnify:CR=1 FL=1